MLNQYFTTQLEINKPVTAEVYAKIDFKKVWSGETIRVGDTVLYAYAYPKGTSNLEKATPLLFSLLDRELEHLDKVFLFVEFDEGGVPVLRFR